MNKFLIAFFATAVVLSFSFLIIEKIDSKRISAVVVPHHDLASNERAKILKEAGQIVNPETIIIISPNHFNAGNAGIITTDKDWNILDAQIFSDKKIIAGISDKHLALKSELPFSREHGIFNLLAPIHENFPSAKIVPIIIKPETKKKDLENIITELNTLCGKKCLLVASVDFSHYLPGALAEIHDKLSIRALNNLDENLIWQAEVDSREALFMAMNWAKMHESSKFVLKNNTNSGKINDSRDAETTSYVFGWYEKGSKKEIKPETTFLVYKGINEKENNIGERFFRGTDQKNENGNLLTLLEKVNLNQTEKDKVSYLNNLINNKNLTAAGSINSNNIQIVLMPWRDSNGKAELLRGSEKTDYIKNIRDQLKIIESNINYGYDIIEIER